MLQNAQGRGQKSQVGHLRISVSGGLPLTPRHQSVEDLTVAKAVREAFA